MEIDIAKYLTDEQTSAIEEYESQLSNNNHLITKDVVQSLITDVSNVRLKVCHSCDSYKDGTGECPTNCPMDAVCQRLTSAWCLLMTMEHNIPSTTFKNAV